MTNGEKIEYAKLSYCDFRERNETEYNRISILLPEQIIFKRAPVNKGEKHMQYQFKKEKSDILFAACRIYNAVRER